MSMLLGLWSILEPFKDLLLYVGGALAVIGGIYWKGKSDAKDDMERAAVEKAYRDARQRDAIEDDISSRTDDDAQRMLNPWFRD